MSDTAWDTLVLTGEDFEFLGRAIEDIVIDAEARDLTGLFEYRVAVQQKFRDGEWQPAASAITAAELLLGTQSAEGYTVGTEFNDRQKLGYRTRLILQYHAKSTGGGAVGDSASLSVSAAVRFFAK